MFCNQCGRDNPANVLSCVHCGGPLAPTQPMYAGQQQVGTSPYGAAPAFEPQTSGKATASLICGILSLVCFGFLTGIPAIILGHMSKSEIRKSLGRLKGEGLALAGLIMGYISVAAIPLVLIIAAIAIPNLLKARMSANEASARASVQTVVTSTMTYQMDKNSLPSGLSDLEAAGLIDAQLGSGMKSGYRFEYSTTDDQFFIVATPMTPGTTGIRSFCAGNDGVVRFTRGGEECTLKSPMLQ